MAPLVWLVTGTSSGFGATFVDSILAKGDKVIATARGDVSRIASLKEKGAATLSLDVTAPQQTIDQLVDEVVKIYGQIDVLVNNAGYIQAAVMEELDEELLMKSYKNNVVGPLNLTRAVLRHMRGQKTGTVMFMGSIDAYMGCPGSLAYTSTKGAIDTLVTTIAMEVAPYNIRCTTLIPGFFRTSIMQPGIIKYEARTRLPEYAEMNKMIEEACYGISENQEGDPKKATDIVVDVVHGDGVAQGKPWPERLPLGADAVQIVRDNCKAKLELCDEWEEIVTKTGVDGAFVNFGS